MRLNRPGDAVKRLADCDPATLDREQRPIFHFNYGRALEESNQLSASLNNYIKSLDVGHGFELGETKVRTVAAKIVEADASKISEVVPLLLGADRSRDAANVAVMALRLGPGGLAAIEKYIDECRQLDVELAGLLIDSFEAGQFGGTGRVANWDLLKQWEVADDVPLILAGGLTAENVAEAIATVQPVAVDTASGVEISPGIKDPARVKAFIDAARRAFEELE